MPKISLPDPYNFQSFFDHGVNDGGTPYMGISPGKTCPCAHRPAREREPINTLHLAALLRGNRSGRMSLKKCVFGSGGQSTQIKYLSKSTDTYSKILLQ